MQATSRDSGQHSAQILSQPCQNDCGYIACPSATSGATPTRLLSVGLTSSVLPVPSENSFCNGVACSAVDGTIWVISGSSVQIFSAEGAFLRANSMIAMGVAIAENGDAYIAQPDYGNVVVCEPSGKPQRVIAGALKRPFYLAIDNAQRLLFVSDEQLSCVQVLKLDGAVFVRSIGTQGEGAGQFRSPRGIALSGGEVGKFLRSFGSRGSSNPSQFECPLGLAADAAGNILVCDFYNGALKWFTAHGVFVTALAEDVRPYGVCVDDQGRILIGGRDNKVHVLAFE